MTKGPYSPPPGEQGPSPYALAEMRLRELDAAVQNAAPSWMEALRAAVSARTALEQLGLTPANIDDEMIKRWAVIHGHQDDDPVSPGLSLADQRVLTLALLEEVDVLVTGLGRQILPGLSQEAEDGRPGVEMASIIGELSRRVEGDDGLAGTVRSLRDAAVGVLVASGGSSQEQVAVALGVTRPRVNQILQEQFEEVPAGDDVGTASPSVDLSGDEQLLLNGLLLHYMDLDLALLSEGRSRKRRMALRREFASAVRARGKEISGRIAVDTTGVAERPYTGLRELVDAENVLNLGLLESGLAGVADPGKALTLLVEIAGTNPWAAERGVPASSARHRILQWAAMHLEGAIEADVARVEAELPPPSKSGPDPWKVALGAATLGAVVLAGPAAAVAAAAFAPAGLAGAAATSAGLAALGGGSVAAGGLGMAGGTAVLGTVGALSGAGAGAGVLKGRSRISFSKELAGAERRKLVALVRLLKDKGGACEHQAEALISAVEGQIAVVRGEKVGADKSKANALEARAKTLVQVLKDIRNSSSAGAQS